MKQWEKRQKEKGYLTWDEFLEAVKEDEELVVYAETSEEKPNEFVIRK